MPCSSREQVIAQRGAYLPTVSASVQPGRPGFAHTFSNPLESGSETYGLTTISLSIAYAPDLFVYRGVLMLEHPRPRRSRPAP